MVANAAEKRCRRPPGPASDPPINEDGHVLKSRRGLLAAGLAVAVVGTIGVASTVNAGAEQLPSPPPAKTAPVAADEDVTEPAEPPAKLPWGARPGTIKEGRAGASSASLRAAGLDAALPEPNDSLVPEDEHGPKGRSGPTKVLSSERTTIAPPRPLGKAAAKADTEVKYLYAVGSQEADTEGFYANVTIAKPKLAEGDYHSLAELAVQSADEDQIVEVGWTVDPVVNGDYDPHLFVFHWVNDVPACYNGCGFVNVSDNIKPGSTLSYGDTKKFGIQNYKGDWWIAFDDEWVGYFPGTLWSDKGVTFERSGLVQVFGEVASTTSTACSEMGNGESTTIVDPKTKELKENEDAARLSSTTFIDGPKVELNIRTKPKAAAATSRYTVHKMTAKSFRFGGQGKATGC